MLKQPPSSLAILADVAGDSSHVGDEAMLAANLETLRRDAPDVQVTVIGRSAEEQRPETAAAVLAGAGGLFLSGGGNLSSSWPELLRQRIVWLGEARRLGLPVVTGGQTIGPELGGADRSALADTLAGVAHLGVRELPSAALAIQMGVSLDRLCYQPDDAFFLTGRPPSEVPFSVDAPFLAITLDPAFAAVGSRSCLLHLAAQLARIAAETGLRLVFLPHVGPLGEPGDEDGRSGAAFCRLVRSEGVECVLMPVMEPAETVWLTQRAAAIVSSRYHPLVFGTAAAVPCLGIYRDAYTRIKLQGALAHVGAESWCLPETAVGGGGLLPAFRRLWQERREIGAAMTRARALLEAQETLRWQLLLARLGRGAEPTEAVPPTALGWPADRLAAAALGALALERQAGDAEARHWRATVNHLERSVDLAAGAIRNGDRRTMQEAATLSGQSTAQFTEQLTEQQWQDYSRDGFLRLGKVLEPDEIEALKQRADDLAQGTVHNPDVQMQLDTGGAYEDLPAAVRSFDQGTMLYRKIQGLETDDLYSRLVRHPLFLEICARVYGSHSPISIFRAMVMNKPAGQGTILPWHQDGGAVWALDRDPLVTIWVALDPATTANGCMEIVPGTHRLGLLTTFGSTVQDEDVARHCPPESAQPLEVEPGHAVLLHNWLIHRSGVNPSPVPRRAFTACYMDGRTQSILTGSYFPCVAGSLPADLYPFVRQLHDERAVLRDAKEQADTYARSLEGEVARLREMREEAERYAKSLEAARQQQPTGTSWLARARARLAAAR